MSQDGTAPDNGTSVSSLFLLDSPGSLGARGHVRVDAWAVGGPMRAGREGEGGWYVALANRWVNAMENVRIDGVGGVRRACVS